MPIKKKDLNPASQPEDESMAEYELETETALDGTVEHSEKPRWQRWHPVPGSEPIRDPFARLPNETDKAYRAFIDYLELGPGRTLRGLNRKYRQMGEEYDKSLARREEVAQLNELQLKNLSAAAHTLETNGQTPYSPAPLPAIGELPPARSYSQLGDWCRDSRWIERVQMIESEEAAALARERLRRRAARQAEIEESEWRRGGMLVGIADEVLARAGNHINTTKRTVAAKLDKKGNVIEPEKEIILVKLDGRFGLKAMELGDYLQRLSAGMPTSAVRTQGDVNNLPDAHLLDELTRAGDRREEEATQREQGILNEQIHDPNTLD